MRTERSIENLAVSLFAQILNILLQFVLRTIFIKVLSTEYLGLNGLFSNILSYLSFAELGFGAAITFSLYRPLAENDYTTVAGIMYYYKKVYYFVGCFVLIVGTALTPLLPHLISEMPNITNIYFIYVLWVINSGLSYFWVYKSTLIIADQRKDIVEKNNVVFKLLQLFLQAAILFITHNYILYLLVQIIVTVLCNMSISIIADRRYPYLKNLKNEAITDEAHREIKKNVSATILHKVGAVVIFGTDNILLSKFFGLIIVGVYSNYYLIINTLSLLTGQIQASIVASVGNLGVTESTEKKLYVFQRYLFINFWVFCFTSSCLLSLLNPFVEMWIGEDFLLPYNVVIILVFNYFLNGFRSAAATFNNAFGLFWNTRKLPVVESVLNILLSIVFSHYFGYIGVFIGTTISSLITGIWYEPYVLYKVAFNMSPKKYYLRVIEYFFVAAICSLTSLVIFEFIDIDGIIGIIVKFIVAGIVPNVMMLLIYYKSKRFEYLKNYLYKILNLGKIQK
jgi:O-antigen/teichoic acid export membrane protein